MPSNWAPMPDDARVMYVELPLPPGCNSGAAAHTGCPAPPALDQATVEAMMYQVTRRPAWQACAAFVWTAAIGAYL